VFVKTPTGHAEREIEVGLSNDRMAEIRSGLTEGEEVVMNPRALLTEQERTKYLGGDKQAGTRPGWSEDGQRPPAEQPKGPPEGFQGGPNGEQPGDKPPAQGGKTGSRTGGKTGGSRPRPPMDQPQ
jgi:hypothetical protein